MTNKNQLHFEPIQNSEEIRRTLTTFNAEAPNYSDRAKNLLRQTSYWVFDPTAQTFGPSKFIGLRNMNFSQYNLALEMRSTGKLTHFDGNVTQTEIEKYLGEYKPSQELSSKLIDWGERLFGAGVFDNVTKNKWKFTSLLPVESSNTTTYLLTWNPERWHWDNIQNDLASIKKQGYCLGTWSCGVTKKILPDDRVFLIKLGKEEPRGIVASGWATSEVFEDEHWDEEAALEEKTALYIDVHFDTILDPEKTIFPRQKLDKGIYVKMNWQPQASGVTIPDDVASQLEIDWAKFVGQALPLAEGYLPEEADATQIYKEGTTKQITVNRYERSAKARSICIKHFGLDCSVCGFNFEKVYGQVGENFVHVHHLNTLSEVGDDYELNPIEDLRPVCPNCHAMLHKRKPAYTIQELQEILQQVSNP